MFSVVFARFGTELLTSLLRLLTFVYMDSTLPIKNLIRLNWLLVVAFTAISSVYFVFLLEDLPMHKIFYTVMTGFGIGLVGFANVGILILLEQRFNTETKRFKAYRLLYTYAASAVIYIALSPVFDHISKKSDSYPFLVFPSIFVVSSVVVNTVIVIFHDFIILHNDKARAGLELSKLKTANAEAANLLLKQQIHPHFLFNALNTLKALYRKDPSAGDIYIVHLANFLRASVYNHAARVSSLEEELTLLSDYLEMQKIRFGTALDCTIDVPDKIQKDRYLPSFSLQPLLENAIKHNDLTQEAPLIVHIFCLEERIVVYNNLQKKSVNVSSTFHGLANLAERYSLLSGDEILIKEDKSTFSVSIKLLTNEYSDHRG